MLETWVQSLGCEDPLEKGMATHSSILAWRIPWTEEPGRLQSTGFSKEEYCSGLPFPSPGDLRNPGIKPRSPVLRADSYHLSHQGSACYSHTQRQTQPVQSPELPPDLRAGAQSLRTRSHCLTPSAGNRNRIYLFRDLDTKSGRALLPPSSSGSGVEGRSGVKVGYKLGGPRSGCLCSPP